MCSKRYYFHPKRDLRPVFDRFAILQCAPNVSYFHSKRDLRPIFDRFAIPQCAPNVTISTQNVVCDQFRDDSWRPKSDQNDQKAQPRSTDTQHRQPAATGLGAFFQPHAVLTHGSPIHHNLVARPGQIIPTIIWWRAQDKLFQPVCPNGHWLDVLTVAPRKRFGIGMENHRNHEVSSA